MAAGSRRRPLPLLVLPLLPLPPDSPVSPNPSRPVWTPNSSSKRSPRTNPSTARRARPPPRPCLQVQVQIPTQRPRRALAPGPRSPQQQRGRARPPSRASLRSTPRSRTSPCYLPHPQNSSWPARARRVLSPRRRASRTAPHRRRRTRRLRAAALDGLCPSSSCHHHPHHRPHSHRSESDVIALAATFTSVLLH